MRRWQSSNGRWTLELVGESDGLQNFDKQIKITDHRKKHINYGIIGYDGRVCWAAQMKIPKYVIDKAHSMARRYITLRTMVSMPRW